VYGEFNKQTITSLNDCAQCAATALI